MTTPPAPTVPPEYTAARHIFSAPALARRLSPFIADADFDWAGIFTEARTMSTQKLPIVSICRRAMPRMNAIASAMPAAAETKL